MIGKNFLERYVDLKAEHCNHNGKWYLRYKMQNFRQIHWRVFELQLDTADDTRIETTD